MQKRNNALTFFNIQPNEKSHQECVSLIKNASTIIFMGHGSHQKLSGARNEHFSCESLLSASEMASIPDKSWILFSCNSNDLLKKCESTIRSGIGFGNLPTDISDVIGIREFDSSYNPDISEPDILAFRESINYIIVQTVSYFVDHNGDSSNTYVFIKLLITKLYVQLSLNNSSSKIHANLLFEMKEDSLLISNLDRHLIG
ncbi:MAG TPA: hypothetical protein PKI42_20755 [Cyclobacteriaceae bacterium]|nr:hypothetical protein [Cyclobacteriaceae bacterium]HMX49114.1 hypothetical protein [Cyclobacteriaceae bacterium]HNC12397.1 hypothetical protein [Cyclobacteriaceae bacterium]HNC29109.1 hypothetical protein [Cyclobacteriaceae bacterium]HNG40743.1 hypothetical protein [Cyclobacteriaceae bacterium]